MQAGLKAQEPCCSCHQLPRSRLVGWHQLLEGDGSLYEGDWQDGVLSGFGTLKSTFGRYNGEWEGHRFNGKGSFYFPEGDTFEGVFQNGNPVRGVLLKPNGSGLQVTFSGERSILDPDLEPLTATPTNRAVLANAGSMVNLFPPPEADAEQPMPDGHRASSPVEQASRASTVVDVHENQAIAFQTYNGISIPCGPTEVDSQTMSLLVCECHGRPCSNLDGTHLVTLRDDKGQELMHYMGEYRYGRRHGTGVWQGGGKDGMFHYSGEWMNGLMNGEGVFTWRHKGHSFQGIFRMGCPVKGVITTSSCRSLACSFVGNLPILSPGLKPETYAAIDTDIDDDGNLRNPILNSRVLATPEPEFRECPGTPIDRRPHRKDTRLSQVQGPAPQGVERHCSCHERPLPLLYQGEHEVWYERDCVYKGGWLDGNWHGKGIWIVKNKYYVGHWVCGLFTAIISFENAGDEEKDQVRGQIEWRNGSFFQGYFNRCHPTIGVLWEATEKPGATGSDCYKVEFVLPKPGQVSEFANGLRRSKLEFKTKTFVPPNQAPDRDESPSQSLSRMRGRISPS